MWFDFTPVKVPMSRMAEISNLIDEFGLDEILYTMKGDDGEIGINEDCHDMSYTRKGNCMRLIYRIAEFVDKTEFDGQEITVFEDDGLSTSGVFYRGELIRMDAGDLTFKVDKSGLTMEILLKCDRARDLRQIVVRAPVDVPRRKHDQGAVQNRGGFTEFRNDPDTE